MKHLISCFVILWFAMATSAQVQVYNKGVLTINNGIVHCEGNFINDTSSGFINNGEFNLKGNLTNHQPAFLSSTGSLNLNGNTRQLIRGSSPFSTQDLSVQNGNGVLLESDFIIKKDLVIQSGILFADTFNIKLGGNISSLNKLDISAGELELNGSVQQDIPANAFLNNKIARLIIGNNVKFNGADTITGEINFAGPTNELATDGLLVLRSDSNGTARVGDLTVGGIYTNNSITGQIVIERYISARKAWRLLSAPLHSNNAPTINASWQEGSTSGNPVPGYGVHITGGTTANGFDQSATNLASIKVYDNISSSFKALPSVPGTNIPITSYSGYFLYLRGDRSINLMQGANAAVTSTTLRMKGNLNTGEQVVNVNAAGFTVVGNPFPSAIDFKTITRSNVRNAFYVWDPALSGAYGLGAYVSFSWNNSTGQYDKTSSASPVSQYIPSGEAFIVQSSDGLHSGSVTIRETDKTTKGSDDVYGRSNGLDQRIRVDLFSNADNALLDGVLNTFDISNENAVNSSDALKLQGTAENISIDRDGQLVSIERRSEPVVTDTILFAFHRMRNQEYKLRIESNNLNSPGEVPYVLDAYVPANDRSIDPDGITEIVFTVNSDPASYLNRFRIVFKRLEVLPVTFTTIKAERKNETAEISWTTENEVSISHFEIERSKNGAAFTSIGTKRSQPGYMNVYSFTDPDPFDSESFYRVKSISTGGIFQYSPVAKIKGISSSSDLVISPNPVKGNLVKLHAPGVKTGIYQVKIFNDLGQQLFQRNILHNGSSNEITIRVDLIPGNYLLQLQGNGKDFKSRLLMN